MAKWTPLQLTKKYQNRVIELASTIFEHTFIDFFSHIEYFPDATSINLSSNYEITSKLWKSNLYLTRLDLEEMPKIKVTHKSGNVRDRAVCKIAGLDHIVLIKSVYSSHYETNLFGSKLPLHQVFDLYANHMALFELFVNYFRRQADEVITEFRQNPYHLSQFNQSLSREKQTLQADNDSAQKAIANKLAVKYKLSAREVECMHLLSEGKSVKEIAQLIGLSPNTIKSYIKNLKNKVRCNKVVEVIQLFYQSN